MTTFETEAAMDVVPACTEWLKEVQMLVFETTTTSRSAEMIGPVASLFCSSAQRWVHGAALPVSNHRPALIVALETEGPEGLS
jgi:hypothetical protein